MKIVSLTPHTNDLPEIKEVQIFKYEGKYYVQLEDYPDLNCLAELCLSLKKENHAMKERLKASEEVISFYKSNNGINP